MKRILLSVAVAALATSATAETIWTISGFEQPESALLNPVTGNIIVSNVVGGPGDVDGNGYLSLVAPDGTVVEKKWATGLDGPKGMALVSDQLFVADITNVRVLDANSGEQLSVHAAEGSVFLNDVTTDGKDVYISDMMTHTIWKYSDGTLESWMTNEALAHPNGLLWDDGKLLVGSWGVDIQEDFTTKEPGALLSVDPATMEIKEVTDKLGNLDGIIRIGDMLYVSDWIAGTIYSVSADGSTAKVAQYDMGAADLGQLGDSIVVPHMMSGELHLITK